MFSASSSMQSGSMYTRGNLATTIVSMNCPEPLQLPATERASYAQRLMYFRLLISLLQRPNVYNHIWGSLEHNSISLLRQQAGLSFSWQLWSTIKIVEEAWERALYKPCATMIGPLPDLCYKYRPLWWYTFPICSPAMRCQTHCR